MNRPPNDSGRKAPRGAAPRISRAPIAATTPPTTSMPGGAVGGPSGWAP